MNHKHDKDSVWKLNDQELMKYKQELLALIKAIDNEQCLRDMSTWQHYQQVIDQGAY